MVTFTYPAKVVRVIDGDTLEVAIDLGFKITHTIRVRLAGIDAPEAKTPEGDSATTYLFNTLPVGTTVVITTHKSDIYGRYIADVIKPVLEEQININKLMVTSGNAVEKKY